MIVFLTGTVEPAKYICAVNSAVVTLVSSLKNYDFFFVLHLPFFPLITDRFMNTHYIGLIEVFAKLYETVAVDILYEISSHAGKQELHRIFFMSSES